MIFELYLERNLNITQENLPNFIKHKPMCIVGGGKSFHKRLGETISFHPYDRSKR